MPMCLCENEKISKWVNGGNCINESHFDYYITMLGKRFRMVNCAGFLMG
jgi:hypothetical protein